jgi:Plasmid pRiA4b ORF-3-like protein
MSIAIYQLRVVLCGVSPLVWRRLLVVSTTSIAELHEILQSAFGWSGEHLHRFLIHGAAYGIPHLGGIVFREDARGVPLSRFRLHCGERFRYEYDFTADWKLDIRLEGALPFDPKRALRFSRVPHLTTKARNRRVSPENRCEKRMIIRPLPLVRPHKIGKCCNFAGSP